MGGAHTAVKMGELGLLLEVGPLSLKQKEAAHPELSFNKPASCQDMSNAWIYN